MAMRIKTLLENINQLINLKNQIFNSNMQIVRINHKLKVKKITKILLNTLN